MQFKYFIFEEFDKKGLEYRIFDLGANEDTVQQLIVPPMTIKGFVDYINQEFGIFTGPIFRYANYAGQILLWDLKQMFEIYKDAPWITLHKLPSHFISKGKFDEIHNVVRVADDEFITYDNIQTIHHANANVARYGYDNIYIYHPHEDIAVFQKRNLDEIIDEFGIWHESKKMKFNSDLKNRKLYFSDMVGHEINDGFSGEYNDSILTQDMATSFQNAAAVRLTLYRDVKIHMMQKVGEVLFLQPYSEHEMFPGSNYSGGYLISDSEILFTKSPDGSNQEDNINCICHLTCYRTTQSKD